MSKVYANHCERTYKFIFSLSFERHEIGAYYEIILFKQWLLIWLAKLVGALIIIKMLRLLQLIRRTLYRKGRLPLSRGYSTIDCLTLVKAWWNQRNVLSSAWCSSWGRSRNVIHWVVVDFIYQIDFVAVQIIGKPFGMWGWSNCFRSVVIKPRRIALDILRLTLLFSISPHTKTLIARDRFVRHLIFILR